MQRAFGYSGRLVTDFVAEAVWLWRGLGYGSRLDHKAVHIPKPFVFTKAVRVHKHKPGLVRVPG